MIYLAHAHKLRIATATLITLVAIGLVSLGATCADAALLHDSHHQGATPVACQTERPTEGPSCRTSDHHLDHRALLPPFAILPGSYQIRERDADSAGFTTNLHTDTELEHSSAGPHLLSRETRNGHLSVRFHLLNQVFLN